MNRSTGILGSFLRDLCLTFCPGQSDLERTCPSATDWSSSERRSVTRMCSGVKCSWVIPLGGNAFTSEGQGVNALTSEGQRGNACTSEGQRENAAVITPCGLANWSLSSSVISVFFHSTRPGDVLLALRLKLPKGRSRLRLTVSHHLNEASTLGQETVPESTTTEVDILGQSSFQLVPCGKFLLPEQGYIRLDLQGLTRSEEVFATHVSHILILPESSWFDTQTCVKFVADPGDFYFGRRGPSVHLKYNLSPVMAEDIQYFYTQLLVPSDQDVIGAYYCAAGFHGGYFGIQVNSRTERRVLFSIWSAYETDNPATIPPEYRVKLVKKGPEVIVGEFGDEGSGGQSYLKYPWKTEQKYGFLVHASPSGSEDTLYTAWFNRDEETLGPSGWGLIASFIRPKDSSYLKGLYAFSENFLPEMGHVTRRCEYGNQWVWSSNLGWSEITRAAFTADATAAKENRMDICGGVGSTGEAFFLQNCGFFSQKVDVNAPLERRGSGKPPQIDFATLP